MSSPVTPLSAGPDKASAIDSRPHDVLLAEDRVLAADALFAGETREMSRLAAAVALVVLLFALASILIVLETGDPASAAAGMVQAAIVAALIYGRRQLLLGRSDRGVLLIVVSLLAACIVMASIPPPVPALGAAPVIVVAFSLSLLHGRPLKAALIAAWIVAIITATIVEFTPTSPDLPEELAAASRVGTFAALVGLIALILYRHRRRLEEAVVGAQAAGVALGDSEARYRLLFEGIVDAVFVHELNEGGLPGRMLAANDAACQRLGYARDELIGTSMPETDMPDEPLVARDRAERLRRGERVLFEQVHVARDRRRIPVEVNTQRFEMEGRTALLSVVRDVSDRRRAEAELRESEDLLRQAHKMESVGRLAGGIAHDFNNMLLVILGHAELALQGLAPGDPLHADLDEIQTAARHSADLTRQLLTFARKQPIAPRTIDLNDVVERTLRLLQRLIGEDIELVWRADPGLWSTRIDPVQVEQILTNLSINARDSITGGGTITIAVMNVGPNGAPAGPPHVAADYVRLSVQDTGCGMDEETLEHLFEPFYTTKGPDQGTGLGLATVYGIATQNGGFVDAVSAPGQGAIVSVCLPRSASVDRAARPEPVVHPTRGGTETVLLVEDEPQLLRLGATMLRSLGYAVLVADGGPTALQVCETHAAPIHLLLTDVTMPGMSGPALVAGIRALRPGIACLLVSGHGGDLVSAIDPGGDHPRFLQKPFSLDELAAAVRDALRTDVP